MMIVKDNGYVYIAKYSWLSLCSGHSDTEWCLLEENVSMWKVPNEDDIIVALTGSNASFISDALRYEPDFVRGELSLDKIILEVIPELKELLKACGKLSENGRMRTSLVLAQKDRAYVVTGNFNCYEVEGDDAVGSDKNFQRATLFMCKDLSPNERFRFSAKARGKAIQSNEFPLYVIDTKTCKPYLLREDEN